MGIGETLLRALAKLVMREAGDQANKVCRNLQLYADLEDGIEVATHAVGKIHLERVRQISSEEEARIPNEEEDKNEVTREESLMVETEGTEEETAEILEEALGMEAEEEGKGEEGGDGTIRTLRAIEFLTQEAESSRTT